MASLEAAIRTVLLANAGISAAVGGQRVRPLNAAQADSLPYITTNAGRDDSIKTLEGGCDYKPANFELGIFAATYSACRDLSELVRDLVDMYGQTTAGIEFAPAMLQDESDVEEIIPEGSEVPVYCRVQTYSVLYKVIA